MGDYIKMNLQDVRWGMDWIELAQDSDWWHALVNVLMKLWVPYNARNLTNWKPVLLKNDSAPCSNSLPAVSSDK